MIGLLGFAVATATATLENAATSAHTARIAGGDDLRNHPALAIDRIGRVHSLHETANGSGGSVLRYRRLDHPAGSWSDVDAIGGETSSTTRYRPSVAVAADGTLHVAYIADSGSGNPDIYHAERTPGGDFVLDFIDQTATFNESVAMALNGQGQPVIAYTGADDGELRVAFRAAGGTWSDEAADPSAASGADLSIAHSGSFLGEVLVIAHHDWSTAEEDLKVTNLVAFPDGTGDVLTSWNTVRVDEDGDAGEHTSIERSDNGEVAVSYTADDAEVRVAHRRDGTWATETLDAGTDESFGNPRIGSGNTAVRFDAAGQPMVVYAVGQFVVSPDFPVGGIQGKEVRLARRLPTGEWAVHPLVTDFADNRGFGIAAATNGATTPGVSLFLDPASDSANLPELAWIRPYADLWVARDLTDRVGGTSAFTGPSLTHTPDGTEVVFVGEDNSGDGSAYWLGRRDGSEFQVNDSASNIFTRSASVHAGDLIVSPQFDPDSGFWAATFIDASLAPGTSGGSALGGGGDGEVGVVAGSDGTIYAAYERSAGGLTVERTTPAKIKASNDAWETEDFLNEEAVGPGIAAGPNGRLAVSFYQPSSDSFGLLTRAPSGTWSHEILGDFGPTPPLNIDLRDGLPSTDAAYIGDTAYVAIATTSSALGGGVSVFDDSGDLVGSLGTGAEVVSAACASDGETLHIAYRARADGGVPAHIGYGSLVGREIPGTPVLLLPPDFEDYDPAFDGFALDLDSRGFPKIVTVLDRPGSVGNRLIVAQPADALDPDGDGFPRLIARALAVDAGAAGVVPAASEAERLANGDVRLRHRFDHPALGQMSANGSAVRLGDVSYRAAVSGDLDAFGDGIPTGASVQHTLETPITTTLEESVIRYDLPPAFIDANARLFSRLDVRRETPPAP